MNTEFKNSLDLTLLGHLLQAVASQVIASEYYASQMLSMLPYSDEWTVDNVVNKNFGKDAGSFFFPDLLGGGEEGADDKKALASGQPG